MGALAAVAAFWGRIPWAVKRIITIVAAVALVVALAASWGASGERKKQAATAERIEEAVETGQTKLNTAAAEDAKAQRERVRETAAAAEEAIDDLHALPGADAPLDPALVRRWRDGVCSLRARTGDAGPECAADPAHAGNDGPLRAQVRP